MRFLLDECCDVQLISRLKDEGHNVQHVVEGTPGVADAEVLEKAYLEKRILITEDKDFGELVYRLRKKVVGIILLRFSPEHRLLKWPRLRELIEIKSTEISGKFVVVDENKFRIRSLH